MKYFRGLVRDDKGGQSSRSGTRHGGLHIRAQSTHGDVVVNLYEVNGVDHVTVYFAANPLTQKGASPDRMLYRGPVDGSGHVDLERKPEAIPVLHLPPRTSEDNPDVYDLLAAS